MKKKIAWGLFGGIVLALLVWAFMPNPLQVEVAAVTQGRFERAVQEDGKTRVRERYVVTTPVIGRIDRISLKQGDYVTRGAGIATLLPVVPTLLDARSRAEQMARVAAVESAIARAGTNAERAAAALEQARTELNRSNTLAQQGFVSPTQHETARLNVRLREKEWESVRQEQNMARHELEQARAVLGSFEMGGQGPAPPTYAITAPVSGRVLRVLQQSEGVIAAGTPLLELGDPSQLEVVLDVLTEDAAQIQTGTSVELSNWGGPAVLAARVRLVEPSAFTKVSALGVEEQRVNAIVDITAPPQQWTALGDGFKVDVRVLVQVVDSAVKVPVSALFPLGARSGVFVLESGRVRLRAVDVAARNGVEAWIKAGLRAGDNVVVYPDTKLQDGDRVKPR